MVILKKILLLIFLIAISFTQCSQDYPRNKEGKPTSIGIANYITEKKYSIINEVQLFINEPIYEIEIYSDDLREYTRHDSLELGRTYIPGEIILTTEEKYAGYELKATSNSKKKGLTYDDKFVKGVLIHEIYHCYFNQVLREMKMLEFIVASEYNNIVYVPNHEYGFGAEFMEEGFCEYMVFKMGESVRDKKEFKPKNIKEIIDPLNTHEVKYQYALSFVEPIIEKYGIKYGMAVIIRNKPPSYKEILAPRIYYDRLESGLERFPIQDSLAKEPE